MPKPRSVWVVANDYEQIQCLKCSRTIDIDDVPLLVRSLPDTPFDAWCVSCALWLLSKAAVALVAEEVVTTL